MSPGTYCYSHTRCLWSGARIAGADPTRSIFKNTSGATSPFVFTSEWDTTIVELFSNTSSENLGFDLNGAAGGNFTSVIPIAGRRTHFDPQILEFLAQNGIRPDIAFVLNMYGCGSSNPEAFQKGIFCALEKLKIDCVLPRHGANKEWVCQDLVEGVAKNNIKVQATTSGP